MIRGDCTKSFGASSSGKSVIIASTEGNQDVEGLPGAKIGLTCIRRWEMGLGRHMDRQMKGGGHHGDGAPEFDPTALIALGLMVVVGYLVLKGVFGF